MARQWMRGGRCANCPTSLSGTERILHVIILLLYLDTVILSGQTQSQSEAGHPAESLYQQGNRFYGKKDYVHALRLYTQAVEMDHVGSIRAIARMYWSGEGIPKDKRAALACYRRCAELGDADCQFMIGLNIVPDDWNSWQVTLDDGTEMPSPALRFLGLEAEKWLSLSAARGNMEAQYQLGIMLLDGDWGLRKDVHRALEILRTVAARGHSEAAQKLFSIYESGVDDFSQGKAIQLVPKDLQEASKWHQIAFGTPYVAKDKSSDGLWVLLFMLFGLPLSLQLLFWIAIRCLRALGVHVR